TRELLEERPFRLLAGLDALGQVGVERARVDQETDRRLVHAELLHPAGDERFAARRGCQLRQRGLEERLAPREDELVPAEGVEVAEFVLAHLDAAKVVP